MMKDALRRRRGQALDINIILGADPMGLEAVQQAGDSTPDSVSDSEELGLAPEINPEEQAVINEVPSLPVEEGEIEGMEDVAGALGRDSLIAKALKSKRA